MFHQISKHAIRHNSNLSIEPLKIAFFGSDRFSVASLCKLDEYRRANPNIIESIHVITRRIKPTGRDLKNLIELPVGKFANDLNIPIIRTDSAQEINNLPIEFNLIIAVSFGKLIPGKFIFRSKYGGLNVHPSLLPKYSGSSPIQYALLNDDKYTGCTIQTLHPTKFDQGEIILQSEKIPVLDDDNYNSLVSKLGPIGGELLVKVIKLKSFISQKKFESIEQYSMASKISKTMSEIIWDSYSARKIKRRFDALGPLFCFINVKIKRKKTVIEEKRRVILSDISEIRDPKLNVPLKEVGEFTVTTDGLIVKAIEGYVRVEKVKLEAQNEDTPQAFINGFTKRVGKDMPKLFIN
ncbi:unnamed protein product [Candida verbasci]|uniref:methionyl-tRNA formyltransferase n=1 Tax=Candida verbasci TaxID=1227364 RepID=A0A9W4XMP2_9ASCO|nr:unnamed protein product [Candida verbasci]